MHQKKSILSIFCLLLGLAQAAKAGELSVDLLQNMPTNSDRRCVGIAAVAEALLDGEQVDHGTPDRTAYQLAKQIFKGLSNDAPISYPSHIDIHGRAAAIDHPTALEALSTRVAELYKQETISAWATQIGSKRLQTARKRVIQSKVELLSILDSDPDKTVLFCCFGSRQFPDGKFRESYHAVLLSKASDGSVVVFDPNDPGNPATCKLTENISGLTVEWSCVYRNSGLVTDQHYSVVHGREFFQIARGVDTADTQSPETLR